MKTARARWRTVVLAALGLLVLAACGSEEEVRGAPPGPEATAASSPPAGTFVGSRTCRECHEDFYQLWAPSHHGTAMQPFTAALAAERLGPMAEPLTIAGRRYRFRVEGDVGVVDEEGPGGVARLPVQHVMGGKNVFFLLTPRERGRLQVLPIAYDVVERHWYDTTASMVRHAVGHAREPVPWTDDRLTFNRSCWSCHVSQLDVNYDEATDTYRTAWAEPGINCETCHGPASEHVRAYREADPAHPPESLGLVSLTHFTPAQVNDACAPCHAKAIVIADALPPGGRYVDHFDLTALEDPDFHPDGRDLGENYTLTGWRMSPCARAGELHCVTCHTSSGRYRFTGERANEACLPCHRATVDGVAAHSHHAPLTPGGRCVDCHMPMTVFARMRRSDHSMRPPMPALTLAHGSPNACNLCHSDRDAAWADAQVRSWHASDTQEAWLRRAGLVAAARAHDPQQVTAILAAVADPGEEEMVRVGLIRLLAARPAPGAGPAFLAALGDPSPFVRGAAAAALEPFREVPAVAAALLAATRDDTRLVRVRAAGALAGLAPGEVPADLRASLDAALGELQASFRARPDQWFSHYNLGNLLQQRGDLDGALAAYERATRLRPDAVPPLVNAAMLHAARGRMGLAENALRQALAADADNTEAHFNLGLLLAGRQEVGEARRHLEAAFAADGTLAAAATNLAVLAAQAGDRTGATAWSRKAFQAVPSDARAAWTHAYYLAEGGAVNEAIAVLEAATRAGARSQELAALLADLRQRR